MRYPHFPGVGARIEKRLLALGFRRADGKPDVGKFLRATGWDGRYFYPYLSDRTPSGERLDRLCVDLKTSPAYLLMGVSAPLKRSRKTLAVLVALGVATASVAPEVATPPLAKLQPHTSYRKWLTQLFYHLWWGVQPDAQLGCQAFTRLWRPAA